MEQDAERNPGSGTGGSYPVTFTVTTGRYRSQSSFTLAVNQTHRSQPPTQPHLQWARRGVSRSTTTGTPTPAVKTETGPLPSGVTFQRQRMEQETLSGTPAAGTGGSYPITFMLTRCGTAARPSFTLACESSPAITSANTLTFTVGTAGSSRSRPPAHRPGLTEGGTCQVG